jgi:hypothetical protein
MHLHLIPAIRQIKQNVARHLSPEAIESVCRQAGHRWRERTLGPVTTLHAFLLQILHGNTACTHVSRLLNAVFTAGAYCQARCRLPLVVFERLLERTTQAAQGGVGDSRWRGHRTFLTDGSSFSMPDTPALQRHFGQPGKQRIGCGFPVAHLLALFDASRGLLWKVQALPLRTHDMSQVEALHDALLPGDVLVADRGFSSYVHLALLFQRKIHAVFRVHQRQLVSFRRDRKLSGKRPRGTIALYAKSRLVCKLARFDQIVEYAKPVMRPRWIGAADYAALPETLQVRELRYWTKHRGYRTRRVTLVTTLVDPEAYPQEELAALYGRRWEVETNLNHLKTTMGLNVLHCETVAGVLKELMMFALIYNLVRLVMCAAAERQGVAVQRISFIDALRWLAQARTGDLLPTLQLVPHRPHRVEPRAIKRRPKPYDLLIRPRHELRQALLENNIAA